MFVEIQKVEAENIDEAKRLLSENAGETIERTLADTPEISEIQEVD